MDARSRRRCIFLVLSLLFVSDLCFAKKSSTKPVKFSRKLDDDEVNEVMFSSSGSSLQLDAVNGDVPVVEPSPPGMSPPTMTPPFITPTPPVTNPPDFNPTPRVPTGPNVNPTNPLTPTTTQPVKNPPPSSTTPGSSSGGAWCIAKPDASETALQVALDYACGYGADCSAIQPGATCYEPDTVRDHASYAFNTYYKKNPSPTSCDFGGTAQLTHTDPSHGGCHYEAATSTANTPPTPTMPMNPPTPPTISSPINPYPPGGQTGYGNEPTDFGGLEPTGSPNAANSFSYRVPLFSTMTCFILSLLASGYL